MNELDVFIVLLVSGLSGFVCFGIWSFTQPCKYRYQGCWGEEQLRYRLGLKPFRPFYFGAIKAASEGKVYKISSPIDIKLGRPCVDRYGCVVGADWRSGFDCKLIVAIDESEELVVEKTRTAALQDLEGRYQNWVRDRKLPGHPFF